MAFAVRKLSGEPIIITTVDFPLHKYERNIASLYAEIDRIISQETPPIYRILDAHTLNPSYSDILLYVDLQNNQPGSLLDPRLRSMLVGTHDLLPVLIRQIDRKLRITLPLFPTLEDALRHIRTQLDSSSDAPNTDQPSQGNE